MTFDDVTRKPDRKVYLESDIDSDKSEYELHKSTSSTNVSFVPRISPQVDKVTHV